jgi:hypothetical protein
MTAQLKFFLETSQSQPAMRPDARRIVEALACNFSDALP